MFLLYHSEGCNICEMVLHECYVNDLHTTTCSGMLGHHTHHGLMRHRMPYFCGAYGMVRHRMPYFCGACTGASQNSYFCGEDSVAHHPCAIEY
jgi:hypothetical protein